MPVPAHLVQEAERIMAFLRLAPDTWTSTYILRKQVLRTGDTAGVRRLLVKLEDAGSIEADRSCGNNTRWRVKRHD